MGSSLVFLFPIDNGRCRHQISLNNDNLLVDLANQVFSVHAKYKNWDHSVTWIIQDVLAYYKVSFTFVWFISCIWWTDQWSFPSIHDAIIYFSFIIARKVYWNRSRKEVVLFLLYALPIFRSKDVSENVYHLGGLFIKYTFNRSFVHWM